MKKLLLCLPILISTSIACNSEAELTGNVNQTAPEIVNVGPSTPTETTPSINTPTINQTSPEITGNGFGPDGTPIANPTQAINIDPTINPIQNNPYVDQIGFGNLGQPNQNPGQNAITGIRFTPEQNPVTDVTYTGGQWVDTNNIPVPTNITGHDQFGNPIPGITNYQGQWYCSKGNPIPGTVTGYNKLGNPSFDIPYGSTGSKGGSTIPTNPSQNDCIDSCSFTGFSPNQNTAGGFTPSQNSSK